MVVEASVVRARNRARSNVGFFARAALFVFVFVVMGVPSVSAAPTPFRARGIWLCCGPIVAGTNFVITGGTNSKFSGYDEGTNGNVLGTISGSVSGNTMTVVFTYKISPYAGEVTTYVATVSASGNGLTDVHVCDSAQSKQRREAEVFCCSRHERDVRDARGESWV